MAFLGIAGGQSSVEEMAAFVERWSLTGFPQVADPEQELWARFGSDIIRSSFLFIDGETGTAARTGYGELDETALRERVLELAAS